MSGRVSVDVFASSSNDSHEEFGIYGSQQTTSAATLVVETSTGLNCGRECPRHSLKPVKLPYNSLTPEEREKIKIEYYKTYDLMTGLKTAASLGGTILLFSLFILYKMKCRHRRRGKRHPSATVPAGAESRASDPDVEKEGGGFLNGNPALLIDNKLPNLIAINNVAGSRRSSRVVASPEDFHIFARNESRLSSVTVASSRHAGSRMSCGTILPIHNAMTAGGGDVLPSSNLSIATAPPRVVSPLLSSFSRSPTPRFIAIEDDDDRTFNLLRPDLACCTEPINIQIIQPTPNVSPCGSIRRLSEDVGTLMDGGRYSCRDHSSVLIPLLTLPKPHHAKIKCKSKKQLPAPADSLSAPESDCDGDFTGLTLNASTPATSRRPENPTSEDHHHSMLDLKFIDCSDSDAISWSSDSEAFGGLDSDVGSPSSRRAPSTADFVLDFLPVLQPTQSIQVDSQHNAGDAIQTEDSSDVSETKC